MRKDNYEIIDFYDDSCAGEKLRVIYTVALEQHPNYDVCVDIMVSEESQVIYAMEHGKDGGVVYESDPTGEITVVSKDYVFDKLGVFSLVISEHEELYGKITWTDTEKLLVGLSTDKGDTLERE